MADAAEAKQRGEGGDVDSTAGGDAAHSPHSRLPFLEVFCKSSGSVLRFAFGTNAGFAVHLINLKRGSGVPPVLLIEAVKEGEDPVSFGPRADLVDYGEGWKLQTVVEFGDDEVRNAQKMFNNPMITEDPRTKRRIGLGHKQGTEEYVLTCDTPSCGLIVSLSSTTASSLLWHQHLDHPSIHKLWQALS